MTRVLGLRPVTAIQLFLILAAPVPTGMVWCVGADGHASFELAHNNTCFDCFSPQSHDHDTLTNGESDTHCGDCRDVRIENIESQRGNNVLQPTALIVIAAPFPVGFHPDQTPAIVMPAAPRPPPLPWPTSLRATIVLLI
ncbi:hypothetical protein [Acanthopleuribacter pedis]|uniref:Uncharacterized protein n=1 Tax=Acanthopleuribacter pedis TaxID=442870 RepID=A0A8J7U0V2_9BACT|nr:hypothetical protein [Acanthopleuribacter pedis]MBO1317478.1 hypothetical protein [Acanthopleuribacter pedis]